MGLKTFVKVGNITNLSDARYCAAMGVDDIGFMVDKNNESYISPEEAIAIQEWVSGVNIVLEGIPEIDAGYEYDKTQITPLQWNDSLQGPIILEASLSEFATGEMPYEKLDYILLTGEGDELSSEDLALINEYSQQYPIVLAYGFNQKNILDILKNTSLKGIAMKGSLELKPGFKDYDELADILEAITIDD